MRCPYCQAEIAFRGEEHGCSWPELASGDPPTPEDFGGSDAESHYAAPALWREMRAAGSGPRPRDPAVLEAGGSRREHELKTWPRQFQAVLEGVKTFELRRADRDFRVGDLLILCEWEPEAKAYTGRRCQLRVTYVTDGRPFGALTDGFVCLGLQALRQLGPSLEGRSRPDDLRERGWSVVTHADYRQDGVAHTFWLLTNGNSSVRGNGLTDAEALDVVRREIDRLET